MADFGLSKALTFRVPASDYANREIEDMKYNQQMQKQNEAMAMAKAKLFADNMEFQQGSNPVDAAIIKNENAQLLRDMGALRVGDWATNIDTLAQMNYIKQKYKSTDAVLRSAAWVEANKQAAEFMKLVAKDPTRYNLDDLEKFKQARANYDGSAPLVFEPPRELQDLNKLELDTATKLDPDHYESWHNGNIGAFKGKVSDDRLMNEAISIYKNNPDDYNYRYKGQAPEQIVNDIAKRLASASKTDMHFGTPDPAAAQIRVKQWEANAAKLAAKNSGLYEPAFLNTAYIQPGPKILEEAFTATPPVFVVDENGRQVQVNDVDFRYNGDLKDKGVKFDDNGKPVGGRITGMKEASGYIPRSFDYAKTKGWIVDDWGSSGVDSGTDYQVADKYKKKGELVPVTDKDGNTKYLFKEYATAIIDGNHPSYKARVDKGMAPKLRAQAGIVPDTESGNEDVPAASANEWKSAGWTDEQIKRGVSEGRIKVY